MLYCNYRLCVIPIANEIYDIYWLHSARYSGVTCLLTHHPSTITHILCRKIEKNIVAEQCVAAKKQKINAMTRRRACLCVRMKCAMYIMCNVPCRIFRMYRQPRDAGVGLSALPWRRQTVNTTSTWQEKKIYYRDGDRER